MWLESVCTPSKSYQTTPGNKLAILGKTLRSAGCHLALSISCLKSETENSSWRWYRGDSEAPHHTGRRDQVENAGPSDGAQALGRNVEDRLGDANPPGAQHGRRHSRVDVATTDVAKALDHSRDAEPKAEGDEDHVDG